VSGALALRLAPRGGILIRQVKPRALARAATSRGQPITDYPKGLDSPREVHH